MVEYNVINQVSKINLNKVDQDVVAEDPVSEMKNKVIKDVSW